MITLYSQTITANWHSSSLGPGVKKKEKD